MDPLPARSSGRKSAYGYTGVGLHFAVTIGVFTYAGHWADSNWGTRPWLLIVGVFLGFGLGMVSMLAKIAKLSSTAKKQTPADSSDNDDAPPASSEHPSSH